MAFSSNGNSFDENSYLQTLEKQKAMIEESQQRKGEQPTNFLSRQQCIDGYEMGLLMDKMKAAAVGENTGYTMVTSVIGKPYPPCIARFHDLEKIMIRDMLLETNHRGAYLLLRSLCEANRMTAVMNIVEDEAGTASLVSLYMQEPENIRSAKDILKKGRSFIIKEPYFKMSTSGQYMIRVDHPTDIIWLPEDDVRVPKEWRCPFLGVRPAGPTTPIGNLSLTMGAAMLKDFGNQFYGQGKFVEAVDLYNRAILAGAFRDEAVILRNNRALAYLRMGAYDAALKDASFIQDIKNRSEKALYRGAQALCSLGRYKEAVEFLEVLVAKYPESDAGKLELERSRRKVTEEETGVYNFKTLYKAASKLRPPRMDNATFRGPVQIMPSAGRGRGLFTNKAVKAGELLLCEKAFVYCFCPPPDEMEKASSKSMTYLSVLVDVPGNKVTIGTQADLIRDACNKLALNPSLASAFYDLYHGDIQGVRHVSIDGAPVVDTFLVANIIKYNLFSAALTSKDYIEQKATQQRQQQQQQKSEHLLHTTGLWVLASYINHSCDANCGRFFIGDLMFVRAARDMPAGTELRFTYMQDDSRSKLNEQLSKSWDFKCDCIICTDDRETPASMKIRRKKLIKEFRRLQPHEVEKKTDVIRKLETTYRSPPSRVPRSEMLALHLSLLDDVLGVGASWALVVKEALATLESMGFVIEGTALSSSKIVVKKWGLPFTAATGAWLALRSVYDSLKKNHLAEQVTEYARISWMLFTGEDYTFDLKKWQ